MGNDKYAVSNKLPAKQVSVLTHRKRRLKEEASHHHVKRLNRGFKLKRRGHTFKKPEFFINQYRLAERDTNRIRRCIYNNKLFKGPEIDEPKLLVVTHHRAHKVASAECKKILQQLSLFKLHSTVLLRNDTQSTALLKIIEPYVIFGYPTIQTVRDLIFKHGFLRISGKKTPMNSNKLIEDHLGEHGIICIEDIVHELFTVSENFNLVKKFLLPFNLKAPRDGWKKKIGVSFELGGEYGNRKHEVNELIERCM